MCHPPKTAAPPGSHLMRVGARHRRLRLLAAAGGAGGGGDCVELLGAACRGRVWVWRGTWRSSWHMRQPRGAHGAPGSSWQAKEMGSEGAGSKQRRPRQRRRASWRGRPVPPSAPPPAPTGCQAQLPQAGARLELEIAWGEGRGDADGRAKQPIWWQPCRGCGWVPVAGRFSRLLEQAEKAPTALPPAA